jgi:redox-sensitive bicupin YhaK (pirin superfamily)
MLNKGQLGHLVQGDTLQLSSAQSARFLLLAALPLGEPVVQSGPFVMNTEAEITQAFRDYHAGTLTTL